MSPFSTAWAEAAVDAARQLAGSTASALVHSDLHWGNVLAGVSVPLMTHGAAPGPERGPRHLSRSRPTDPRPLWLVAPVGHVTWWPTVSGDPFPHRRGLDGRS